MANVDEVDINGSDIFTDDKTQEKNTCDCTSDILTLTINASEKDFTKATSDFQFSTEIKIEEVEKLFVCDICNGRDSVDRTTSSVSATSYCKDCRELLCDSCTDAHRNSNLQTAHTIVERVNFAARQTCESCNIQDKIALHICIDCNEVQCNDCQKVHTRQKLTKGHRVLKEFIKTASFCKLCQDKSKGSASLYCTKCHILLCFLCVTEHTNNPSTSDHEIVNADQCVTVNQGLGIEPQEVANITIACPERYTLKQPTSNNKPRHESQPGKPSVVGDVLVDSVCLIWEAAATPFDNHRYEVRMKEDKPNAKWIVCSEQTQKCTLALTNLKSNAVYNFKVRMVNDNTEGPFSELSEPVGTPQSAAHSILDSLEDVKGSDVGMPLKRIPFQEDKEARNISGKTRKLVIGETTTTKIREKTIMLVGATGTGKSTLVDGMINYILGVTWNDPYRLKVVDLEDDEVELSGNQAVSQTQWITCYKINHHRGSRLDYTLNIIDTPGFGDTHGITRDKEIVEQIKTLFSTMDDSGMLYIDAICFLIKAPEARLTPTQRYIFDAILSIFGRDIKDNICIMVTFADGKVPLVLSALTAAEIEYKQYFPFNNSSLFADNSEKQVSKFSQMFWDMCCESFNVFFGNLLKLETRSLRQTRKVLKQRAFIQITIENLSYKLNAGLSKVEEIRNEVRVLEDYKVQIEANKNFTFTVKETEQRKIDLPKGQSVTNCLHCNITCHKDCRYENDEEKFKCSSMDENGNCTQCSGKCIWRSHRNAPYIFEYVSVEKQKTLTDMMDRYRLAVDEEMTRQKVIERMNDEASDLAEDILTLMEELTICSNSLREIALRQDPLSVAEHIDLLIKTENNERRPGYQDRITSLIKCREKATITKGVLHFRKLLSDTTEDIATKANITPKPERKKVRRFIKDFLAIEDTSSFQYSFMNYLAWY